MLEIASLPLSKTYCREGLYRGGGGAICYELGPINGTFFKINNLSLLFE